MCVSHNTVIFFVTILGSCCVVVIGQQINSNETETVLFGISSDENFPYTVIEGERDVLSFNYSFEQPAGTQNGGWVILASLDNEKIAKLHGETEFHVEWPESSGNLSVTLEGKLPGRSTLHFRVQTKADSKPVPSDAAFQLLVEREERPIDVAFNVVVVLLVVTANIGLGAKIDLDVVKKELKRPIAPIIGLSSQFIIMPVVAFVIAYSIELDPGIALGFFALGCAPGGSASNMYTYLLHGNVSLSVTMTLISTMAALGLLPMWLFTLGRVVYHGGEFQIPFQNIFFSLLGIVVPVLLGLFLQRKFPKVAKGFIKAIKYIMVIFIIFVLTVGVYANIYIFSLLSGEVLLAAAALPYLGFVLGGLVAFIFRQDMTNVITIAVETGIQNTGIPIVLLRLSLPGPDKDTSIVAPVASALFTPIPLVFGILYVQLKECRKKRKEQTTKPEAGHADNDSNELREASRGSGDYLMVKNTDDEESHNSAD